MRSRPRRDEFVKRFEEITKQEIKKYNDSLLGTHMALDEFRRSLKGCVDYYAKQVASISSVVKKLEAENIDLKQTIKTLEKKITDQRFDFDTRDKKSYFIESNIIKKFEFLENKVKVQEEVIQSMDVENQGEFIKLNKLVDCLKSSIERFFEQSRDHVDSIKDKIAAIPCDADGVKNVLLKKIEDQNVDNDGILKELIVLKKKLFIQEKYGEYLLGEINKLKEQKSP